MGFVLGGLDKADYDRNYSDSELLTRIVGYYKKYKLGILGMIIGLLLSAGANAFIPKLISLSITALENDLNSGATVISNQLLTLILIILGFYIFGFAINAFQQIITAKTVQSTVFDLREDVFDSILERDISFINDIPTGRLVSRITNDTNDFGQTVGLTTNLFAQVLTFLFYLYFLLTTSIKLTLLILIFAPVIILVALSFRRIARDVAQKSNRVLAKVNALIQETTSGIYIAKAFRAEKTIYDEFDDLNKTSYTVNFKRAIIFNSIFPVLNILTALATAILVYFGALEVIGVQASYLGILDQLPGKALTIGDWYLFITGLNLFFFPLIQIASFWSQFQQGLAGSERAFSLIDAENKVQQIDSKKLEEMKGEIQFNNVTFSYDETTNVLENFNLHIPASESVAIVGHTGAGKSTLAKLISRYYEHQNGQILIDGVDIRELDMHNYRKNLAIISQEVFLWNTSITDNILYNSETERNPDFDLTSDNEQQHIQYAPELISKMKQTVAAIDALDWINNLEDKFETVVGERGNRLSQGQRQLIAFARIIIQDPKILIMDEATASVDPFTELQIQKAIELLMKDRTSIVIAHRLSTVKSADRIIVMKQGKIIEEGNHQELMQQGGHYAELYETYYRHQSISYVEEFAKETSDIATD